MDRWPCAPTGNVKHDADSAVCSARIQDRIWNRFRISELDGQITHGHGGAIYGFSTQLQFIRDQKVGVVVVSSTDVTNAITRRIAKHALQSVLATRVERELPVYDMSDPVEPMFARAIDGIYRSEDSQQSLQVGRT